MTTRAGSISATTQEYLIFCAVPGALSRPFYRRRDETEMRCTFVSGRTGAVEVVRGEAARGAVEAHARVARQLHGAAVRRQAGCSCAHYIDIIS